MNNLSLSNIPRAISVRYSQIIDNVLWKFIDQNNDSFKKSGNIYVFSRKLNAKDKKQIYDLISEELTQIKNLSDITYPDLKIKHIFIIQSCDPEHNLLTNKFTNQICKNRYSVSETDIKIDLNLIRKIWDNFFDQQFKKDQTEFFYIKHQNLNSEHLENILAKVYSRVMKIPYYHKGILSDVSEEISYTYQHSKELHDKLKLVISEVKQFIKHITKLDTI